MSTFHLAVDAGNSKTVALVVDDEGTVLGRGRGGCGDIYGAASVPDALEAVLGAVGTARREAGVSTPDLASAAFRLAGVDYPEDAAFWDEQLSQRLPELGPRSIKNDGFASLRLLDGSGVAVSITVGTGPAVAARSRDGREECSGMFVFDDLGGGGLGNAALAAVCRAWMGLGPATALTGELCELFDVADAWELRHAFTRRFGARPRSDLWRASRVVLAAAGAGDDVATQIVARQAAAFVGYAQWCARRVGVDLASGELPVLLNGSVATSEHPAMRDALVAELARVAPAAGVTVATASPLSGVVLDALAEGGVEVGPRLLARVRDDHPGDFLLT
ncbi:BadF/BadG/BcrA/BcrD ATPase family protein [Luteimicrobium sp. DT211]|uniref:BadF/BadG/BcrA/BcrD ATPase family protein n=1 Tax=Luteimicrobium sp. DT211 TaxID=3393412 RepID=UPI003CEC7D8C